MRLPALPLLALILLASPTQALDPSCPTPKSNLQPTPASPCTLTVHTTVPDAATAATLHGSTSPPPVLSRPTAPTAGSDPPFYPTLFADPGGRPDFALDPHSGGLALLYADTTQYLYAYQDQGQWQFVTAPSTSPKCLSVDSAGTPHTAALTASDITYHSRVSGQWYSEQVYYDPTGTLGTPTASVIPSSGIPAVAFSKYNTNTHSRELFYSRRISIGSWSIPTLIQDAEAVTAADLDVGTDGITRLAYVAHPAGGNPEVRLSTEYGGYFYPEAAFIGLNTIGVSLAMDVDNATPLMGTRDGYLTDAGMQRLVVAIAKVQGQWTYDIVDSSVVNYFDTPLVAAGPGGVQHVLYTEREFSGVNVLLKHASRVPTEVGTFKGFVIDTVTRSGWLGVGGPYNYGMVILSGTPWVCFDYAGEYLADAALYLARPAEGASAPTGGTARGISCRGPWPNPADRGTTARMELSASVAQTIDMVLYDVSGRCVWSERHLIGPGTPSTVSWDCSGIPTGLYFLRVRSSAGFEAARKWVVVR